MQTFSIRRCLRCLPPAVLIVAGTAACVSARHDTGSQPAVIYFTNESLEQVSVYLVGAGINFRRIGTVFPGRTDTLAVPADLASKGGTLNVVARMLNRAGMVNRADIAQTGPVSIRPGQEYQVRLLPESSLLAFLPAGQ